MELQSLHFALISLVTHRCDEDAGHLHSRINIFISSFACIYCSWLSVSFRPLVLSLLPGQQCLCFVLLFKKVVVGLCVCLCVWRGIVIPKIMQDRIEKGCVELYCFSVLGADAARVENDQLALLRNGLAESAQ